MLSGECKLWSVLGCRDELGGEAAVAELRSGVEGRERREFGRDERVGSFRC